VEIRALDDGHRGRGSSLGRSAVRRQLGAEDRRRLQVDHHVGLRAEGAKKGVALNGQLLVLELGPDLLPDRGFLALEPSFIRLIVSLDLLLGEQPDRS
jgi:hypothetical protein